MPVLHRAVVAHLREPEVAQILSDGLINLLVVENTVCPWCHEHERGSGAHEDDENPFCRRIEDAQDVPAGDPGHGQKRDQQRFKKPELTDAEVVSQRRRRSEADPQHREHRYSSGARNRRPGRARRGGSVAPLSLHRARLKRGATRARAHPHQTAGIRRPLRVACTRAAHHEC